MLEKYRQEIQDMGYTIIPKVLNESQIQTMISYTNSLPNDENTLYAGSIKRRGEKAFAVRHLLRIIPQISALVKAENIQSIAEHFLGKNIHIVQSFLFNKINEANWKVPMHQDLTVPVSQKHEIDGFEHWSQIGGVQHVQPPKNIMEKLLAVRLHLDGSDQGNGPLRVIPGSHRHGCLSDSEVTELCQKNEAVECHVPRGGALVMKPLLLHASSSSTSDQQRRVIHLQYAGDILPKPLSWVI